MAVGICLFIAWFNQSPKGPSPDELAEVALHAATELERETAAVKLADYGPAATEALRRVAAQTTDPAVMGLAIEGIGKLWDYDSLDILLNAVERGPEQVRGRAAVVISRMTGRDRRYRSDDSPEDRKRQVRYMREDWQEIRQSPYFDDLKKRLRESHESP